MLNSIRWLKYCRVTIWLSPIFGIFDAVVERHPEIECHLGTDANIVHHVLFEIVLLNLLETKMGERTSDKSEQIFIPHNGVSIITTIHIMLLSIAEQAIKNSHSGMTATQEVFNDSSFMLPTSSITDSILFDVESIRREGLMSMAWWALDDRRHRFFVLYLNRRYFCKWICKLVGHLWNETTCGVSFSVFYQEWESLKYIVKILRIPLSYIVKILKIALSRFLSTLNINIAKESTTDDKYLMYCQHRK